eukprot:4847605-Amphidinium_carterae.1
MEIIFVEQDAVVEFCDDSAESIWKSDPMFDTYMAFAPTWTKMFMKHCLMNGLNSEFNQVPDGFELKFIHTTMSTFTRMELTGDLGSRYAFPSL